MTKSETLYRAGYMSAAMVDTLNPDFKQLPGESWNDLNERWPVPYRIEKIEDDMRYGWKLVSYAIKAKNTNRNLHEYNRGFIDRINGVGYSFATGYGYHLLISFDK